MKQTCVSQPSTVELLDALEAGISALRVRRTPIDRPDAAPVRRNILNGVPQDTDHRIHPFSRIEEL